MRSFWEGERALSFGKGLEKYSAIGFWMSFWLGHGGNFSGFTRHSFALICHSFAVLMYIFCI